ncbi:MAG TPA: SHOCT domain-containing protein [Candidatus Limnocylindria bacterium]|jgi:putative membrane protein
MFWDRHNDIALWWPMGLGALVCLVIIGVLVWVVVRATSQRHGSTESPEELLRRRFAAGEIDEEEFAKRSEVLRRK